MEQNTQQVQIKLTPKDFFDNVTKNQVESITNLSDAEAKLNRAMCSNVNKFLDQKSIKCKIIESKIEIPGKENDDEPIERKWAHLECNGKKKFTFVIERGTDAGDGRPKRKIIFLNKDGQTFSVYVKTNGFLITLLENAEC